MMLRYIKKIYFCLPLKLVKSIYNFYRFSYPDNKELFKTTSYSQEGEDLILDRYFKYKYKGFFIDVGAHHPFRFSNTYLFYIKGWSGINIDAMPLSMKAFERERPRDLNLEVPVSDTNKELDFYIFNEPALNTFDKSEADNYLKGGVYSLLEVKRLATKTLSSILDVYVNVNQEIDFISVDVEGLDLNVLKSNDWLQYKPKIVLVEILHFDFRSFSKNQVLLFMESVGYAFYAKTVNTVFFQRIDI